MSDVIRIKAGSTEQRLAYPLRDREVVADQTSRQLFYGDGSTPGGLPLGGSTGSADPFSYVLADNGAGVDVLYMLSGEGIGSTGSFAGLAKALIAGADAASIWDGAFQNCADLQYIDFGNITSIGWYAFQGSPLFSNIEFPSTLVDIGKQAFSGCSNLEIINLPVATTTIGQAAFENCFYITDVKMPGVTTIGDSAFNNCTALATVELSDNLITIGNSAFSYCTGLSSVTIPDSVTSIGNYAFGYCSGLTNVNAYVAKTVLDVSGSLIETSVTTIHARASDSTWQTTGAPDNAGLQVIGGKTDITVIKDL